MITAAVLTLSDKGSKGERTDESGPAISEALRGIGGRQILMTSFPTSGI